MEEALQGHQFKRFFEEHARLADLASQSTECIIEKQPDEAEEKSLETGTFVDMGPNDDYDDEGLDYGPNPNLDSGVNYPPHPLKAACLEGRVNEFECYHCGRNGHIARYCRYSHDKAFRALPTQVAALQLPSSFPINLHLIYGVQFKPAQHEDDFKCTVVVSNIPPEVTLRNLLYLSVLYPKGVSTFLIPTAKVKVNVGGKGIPFETNTALLVFNQHNDASSFVEQAEENPIILGGRRVVVELLKTPTHPLFPGFPAGLCMEGGYLTRGI